MKAPRLGLAVFLVATIVLVGYLAKVILHQEKPVNFAQDLDILKTRGVPDFRVPTLTLRPPIHITDDTFGKSDFKGQVTIVNFWASWCAPCIKELPSLVALAKKYEQDPRLELLFISEDRDTHQLISFLEKEQALLGTDDRNFKFLWDGNFDVANRFGSQKIPETYIVGKDRKLIRKVIDEQNWVSLDFLKWLNNLLDRGGPL